MGQEYQNIFVGVSVRNKTLTAKNVEEIVSRAEQELNARRLLFLVADELEFINLRVFGRGTAKTISQQVQRRCDEITSIIREGVAARSHDRLHVSIGRWSDVLNTEYWSVYIRVFARFVERSDFRADVERVAQRFAGRRGESATRSQLHFLSLYLLAELPTLILGVRYEQRLYRTMIYPVRRDEAIDRIAERLAQGHYGPSLGLALRCRVVRMEA